MLESQVFLVTGYMYLHLNTNTKMLGTQLCSVTIAFDYMHHTHITHKGPLSHSPLVSQPPKNVLGVLVMFDHMYMRHKLHVEQHIKQHIKATHQTMHKLCVK